MEPPLSRLTGGPGEQVPTVTPAGRLAMLHVADTVGLGPWFVHTNEPEYGGPSTTEVGNRVLSGDIAEPVTLIFKLAVLLAAPVEPFAVVVPVVVDAPLTVQVMDTPAATIAGGEGMHDVTVTSAWRPPTVQLATGAEFVQPYCSCT